METKDSVDVLKTRRLKRRRRKPNPKRNLTIQSKSLAKKHRSRHSRKRAPKIETEKMKKNPENKIIKKEDTETEYRNYCEKELATIAITLLKTGWKNNYDFLYENPSTPLPSTLSPSGPRKLKMDGGKNEDNSLLHLYRYIANLDTKSKKIKMRETVISRFMFVLRLSTLYNSRLPANKHNFTESELTEYTNCIIKFITRNISFDVFQVLKIPARERNAKVHHSDIIPTLDIKISTPETIEKMKIYVGPSEGIKSNFLTSTPLLSFGIASISSDLAPASNSFKTIHQNYNSDCDVLHIDTFIGNQPSNQKSQCVLLSVILYVLSKIADIDYVPSIEPSNKDEYNKHFEIYNDQIFKTYFENVYSSENLVELIHQKDIDVLPEPDDEFDGMSYVPSVHLTLRDILRNVCEYEDEEVVPYNTLISFVIDGDEYVHKSFVNTIHPSVRELIFSLFTDIRLNFSGITLPLKVDKDVVCAPNIITYDRSNLSRSKLSFLQTENIMKTGDETVSATYSTVQHDIMEDSIKDYGLESPESDACTMASIMSYLAYLPTYHVATYKFKGLVYFGAYDPDPDSIKLRAVPDLHINKKSLVKLGDNTKLKKKYLFSYHRIHVWLDVKEKRIYMVIRGTHSSRDWQHSDYLVARGEGHYMDRVEIIDDVLRQIYSDMVANWELGQSARDKYRLIITGHSLGGHLTNITKVLTYKNKLYGFTDTFTNGFPISCQPYYSTNDNSQLHFQILNWAFSKEKGIVLNVEYDGAAELLVTSMKDGKISENLTIFQVTRLPSQKPIAQGDIYYTRLFYMAFTHAPYNFFGKKIWEKIMEHHTRTKLLITGTVVPIDNACINPNKIKYADVESTSNRTIKIETSEFILTTNIACVQTCP
jgi:hypothetical protein